MCGIIGYTGEEIASPILLNGLSKLEYRGYDSAGIGLHGRGITVYKKKGDIKTLSSYIHSNSSNQIKTATCGIGHTRWATHGVPSDENAHPHLSADKSFCVVHNGIIENYVNLKNMLTKKGYKFYSQTDTEVIANLLQDCYQGNFLQAVENTIKQLEGSYALAILCSYCANTVIAVRKDSPLILGVTDKGTLVSSDIPGIISYTKDIFVLDNYDIAVIKGNAISFYNGSKAVSKEMQRCNLNADTADLCGNQSFMIKEINQVPLAVQDTTDLYFAANSPLKRIPKTLLKDIKAIKFVGCGTAYHAGVYGAHITHMLCRIPSYAEIASEYRYSEPLCEKRTLYVFISQSGETADTLGALEIAKSCGSPTIAITNVASSSITRSADYVLQTAAGCEIAVASTKAYNAQLAAVYALVSHIAKLMLNIDLAVLEENEEEFKKCGLLASKTLGCLPQIKKLAKEYADVSNVFFLGRGLDYCVAMEGSLKLKEITYINSQAYPSGELKHGTLALIDKDALVIALLSQKNLLQKSINALHEVKARGAKICAVTTLDLTADKDIYDEVIRLPQTKDILAPLVTVIPTQLLSYYIAVNKGYNADKPRNLAKSVTVE